MRLLQRDHLAAIRADLGEIRVRSRVRLVSIGDQVADRQRIFTGCVVVKPGQAKILADRLPGIRDGIGGSCGQAGIGQPGRNRKLISIRRWPEVVGVGQHAWLQIGDRDELARIRPAGCTA